MIYSFTILLSSCPRLQYSVWLLKELTKSTAEEMDHAMLGARDGPDRLLKLLVNGLSPRLCELNRGLVWDL
jgi:hypothetical protein